VASTQLARSAAEALVGPLDVVTDLSWDHGLAVVLGVVLADGTRAVVKQHREPGHHAAEVDAYGWLVPAIADRAPALLASDPDSRVVVLSHLDGVAAPPHDPAVHRSGGELLRRLHAAADPVPGDGWLDDRVDRLERWIAEAAPGLLDDDDVAWARATIAPVRDMPAPPLVPCHGDWQPRNWLWDGSRTLAFDFERAAPAWWIKDVERMWHREWVDRPELRDAFFDGYGRAPDERELAAIEALAALAHVSTIVWATEVGDEPFADEGRARLARARGVA
jgi:Ser/Thr protein kinase RdoA (MazF antagonist)